MGKLKRFYFKHLRRILPDGEHLFINSVKMPFRYKVFESSESELLRRMILKSVGKHHDGEILDEAGVVGAHARFTKPGDTVNMVGGGYGVSAVHVDRLIGDAGILNIYEGGDRSCVNVREVLRLNEARSRASVYNVVVGVAHDVYGGSISGGTIAINDLPPCDTLELDCEGAELSILRSLAPRPKRIIVEVHPWLFDEDGKAVEMCLRDMGYRIDYRAGHNGILIDEAECEELLRLSATKPRTTKIANGARYPVILSGALSR